MCNIHWTVDLLLVKINQAGTVLFGLGTHETITLSNAFAFRVLQMNALFYCILVFLFTLLIKI